jgi:hypothetical protein
MMDSYIYNSTCQSRKELMPKKKLVKLNGLINSSRRLTDFYSPDFTVDISNRTLMIPYFRKLGARGSMKVRPLHNRDLIGSDFEESTNLKWR